MRVKVINEQIIDHCNSPAQGLLPPQRQWGRGPIYISLGEFAMDPTKAPDLAHFGSALTMATDPFDFSQV